MAATKITLKEFRDLIKQVIKEEDATGGQVRRFNRHEEMDSETRSQLLDIITDIGSCLTVDCAPPTTSTTTSTTKTSTTTTSTTPETTSTTYTPSTITTKTETTATASTTTPPETTPTTTTTTTTMVP